MKKAIQKGFTLIELMIVVAIIAILAAIAISQYQDYVIRTQVSEGSSLASGAKTAVTEFYNNYGTFGSNNASFGLSTAASISGKYVTQVDASGGIITVTYGNEAHNNIQGNVLVYSAVPNAGSMEWNCEAAAGTDVDSKYLPTVCRN
ncbi:pilin [Luteimonas pelagia]